MSYDWNLINRLGRRSQMRSASEVADDECTPIARRWLERVFQGRVSDYGGKARGLVVQSYGANPKGMKHYTNHAAGEINPSH